MPLLGFTCLARFVELAENVAIILAVLYMYDASAFRGQNALKLIMIYDL